MSIGLDTLYDHKTNLWLTYVQFGASEMHISSPLHHFLTFYQVEYSQETRKLVTSTYNLTPIRLRLYSSIWSYYTSRKYLKQCPLQRQIILPTSIDPYTACQIKTEQAHHFLGKSTNTFLKISRLL